MKGLSVAISILALTVSVASYLQSKQAALAAEEAARPRLRLESLTAELEDKTAVFNYKIANVGSASASVTRVRVDTVKLESGNRLGHTFDELDGAILYPGDSRSGELRVARVFKVPSSNFEVDYASIDPSDFRFTLSYAVYGKPSLTFQEVLYRPELVWKD